ncbi:hypothetical protein EVG20_g4496 [Dentipellis fragilis]|uniref:Uncharacterized protein n=1 Tax=Dentipellis fragilis TaxID=205917 RepID=A0A4Y9YZN9_9AGAM|nr:hypothetical protein EVG20_g4496 [Dentipellis fragilis]
MRSAPATGKFYTMVPFRHCAPGHLNDRRVQQPKGVNRSLPVDIEDDATRYNESPIAPEHENMRSALSPSRTVSTPPLPGSIFVPERYPSYDQSNTPRAAHRIAVKMMTKTPPRVDFLPLEHAPLPSPESRRAQAVSGSVERSGTQNGIQMHCVCVPMSGTAGEKQG